MLITEKEKLTPFYRCHRVWQGIPGIVHTKGGNTFICFYSGQTEETCGNYAVVLKGNGRNDFGEPIAAAKKDGDFRCFDPVLWIDPLDRLWFIWNVMPGEEVYASICENPDAEDPVWGEEFYIGHGVMMNKPIVLTSGEWLFPIAVWKKELMTIYRDLPENIDEIAGSYVYKTTDNGKTFARLGKADIRNRSFDEHMVIELKNGILMMLVRTNYGIGASYSYDRGHTWSTGHDSGIPGPCSRFYIGRLRSGRILMINHHNYNRRNNLTALLSDDDGKTFPYTLLLDERADVSYPDAMQAEDGSIYIIYDRERGCFKATLDQAYACAREVLTAKITEEDIINGRLVNKDSYLKNIVCKLDQLAPEDSNPYQDPGESSEAFAERLLREGGNIIGKVFYRYPVNCIDAAYLDSVKLDARIDRFQETGSNNKDLLIQIINMLRLIPRTIPDHSPIIARACSFIEENLALDLPIASIADEMHISSHYLSHLFKAITGISMIEYRNELRLTQAKQLLIDTDLPITQISGMCGFSSAAYFTKIFTRAEKIPPTRFRAYHANR